MFVRQLKTSILAVAVWSVLAGLLYPWTVTALSRALFPRRAGGSLIVRDGKAVGSELIGQPFDDPKYFWGRLSATDAPYNASSSGGSNLGPLNPALLKAVRGRVEALRRADPGDAILIPVDLVTASASGLDPHISPAAAYYQARRVARLRGLSERQVRDLIRRNTQARFLGILGEPAVNVLELNLALDALNKG